MKTILLLLYIITFFSCNMPAANTLALEKRIDSLEKKLAASYTPGLGEFMSSIQVHHAKLWFAGQAQNWELANFEIAEIKESLDDIPVYCANRPEVQKLGMIRPAIDSISKAIGTKNALLFNSSFMVLTNTCNSCHQATQHAFNSIKVPDHPPFSNQDFTAHLK